MKIRKSIIILLLLPSWVLSAQSFDVRIAYSIGATTPYSIPASIRELSSYKPSFSFLIGGDYEYLFNQHWGIMTGIRYTSRGMKAEAKVKQYQMSMVRASEKLTGLFSGNVSTEVQLQSISIPILATFHPSENLRIGLGLTFSFMVDRTFKGNARSGYLREGSPTGPKILIGDDDACSYDFSEDMLKLGANIDLGADWFFSKHFGATASLSIGLTNIFKSDFKTIEQKMFPIYGSLGLLYRL